MEWERREWGWGWGWEWDRIEQNRIEYNTIQYSRNRRIFYYPSAIGLLQCEGTHRAHLIQLPYHFRAAQIFALSLYLSANLALTTFLPQISLCILVVADNAHFLEFSFWNTLSPLVTVKVWCLSSSGGHTRGDVLSMAAHVADSQPT